MNIYAQAFLYGTIATGLAFGLNQVLEYTDNNLTTWLLTYGAFLVGNYIGLSYRAKKNKTEKKSETIEEASEE